MYNVFTKRGIAALKGEMKLFKVMLVEDEVHILKYMKKKLGEFDQFEVCGAFSSPEEALPAFEILQPQVVFLDIEMPRINGIELAKRLLEKKDDLFIIFTTAYGQYAVDAFDVEAVDYLLKPIGDEDIQRVIKRLQKAAERSLVHQNEIGKVAEGKKDKKVSVRCFGNFEVRDREQQLINWPTRKTEELFAYFLTRQGKYVSKWEIIEIFWPEMEEDKSLHNLYNNIYRMKQILKKLPMEPVIKKINEGYILEAEDRFSDLNRFMGLMERREADINDFLEDATDLFFSYRIPLFGTKAYFWCIPIQEYTARYFRRLCEQLLECYRKRNQFQQADEVLRYYIGQHIEDEEIMLKWLNMLSAWQGQERRMEEYKVWFNRELKKADLPGLE